MKENAIIHDTINLNDLVIDPSITGLFAYTSEELYDYATAPRPNGFKYTAIYCENVACEIINRIKERAEYIFNENIHFETYQDSDLYINETIRNASDFIVDNYDEMTEFEIDEYLNKLEKNITHALWADAIARSNHDDGDDECWEDDEEEFFDDEDDGDDECWEDEEEDECWECNESGFWDTFNEEFFDDNALPKVSLSENSNLCFNNTFAQICPFFYETLMNGVDDMIFFKRANSSDELFKIFGEEVALFSKKIYMDYLA